MTETGIDNSILDGLNTLDRAGLMRRMIDELPEISKKMGTTAGAVASRAGIDEGRFKLLRTGKRSMDWSEYMSLLFVLWSDRRSHDIIEERGFFPDALKSAMSINRNMHGEKWRYETQEET